MSIFQSVISDYNNIYLGKRIFGPARKQMFVHSILGGMERRFEIVENQINHIPFTHDASDKHPEKCRNSRMLLILSFYFWFIFFRHQMSG